MKYRVTIKDIAAAAGVSYGTVSRALADSREISEPTKKRIRALCDQMGYVPNLAARSLVTHASHVIGLLVPDISNPYFAHIAMEIEARASEAGYQLLVCNSMRSAELEYTAAERLLRQQVDGLIVSAFTRGSMMALRGLCGSLPVVYLGDNHDGDCCYVSTDNTRGGYLGGQYLTSLGHRRIAFLGGRASSATNSARLKGFHQAMEEAGAEPVIVECPPELDYTTRYITLARQFLTSDHGASAVFAYSDRFALGIMQAASEYGLRIPEDLSLIGYDNISHASLPRIMLSTISHHKLQLAQQATLRLLSRIAGDTNQYHDISQPSLIVRGSCQNIRMQ